ncbi:protein translocase subunit SecF [Thermogemmatispora sp.]|uniref:protein translocase subunit SecF n=1 Tax=Thermogemmatispora sp. TaxID=1968838 RepID=UPI0035E449CA
MFRLVEKRYLFLGLSLLVIIPGILSLIFKGLNVGIDFAGGSSLSLRPEKQLTITTVRNLLKPFPLKDVQVQLGSDQTLAGKGTVWVRLNTTVDSNVQDTIKKDLQTLYKSTSLGITFDDLVYSGKKVTIVTVTNFPKGVTPKVDDIRKALSKLPNTTDTTKATSSSSVSSATPTPTTTATPTATASAQSKATATAAAAATATATAAAKGATPTATATAKATPTATASATPSSGSSSNPANIPVKVMDIRQGTTTQTINILTVTPLDANLQASIESAFVNQGNTYVQLLQTATVQGSVAADTQRNAILAVIAASILILLYIWFAFRKVPRPWRYGICAVLALVHDVLVVLGVSSILGWTTGFQVDALFITALLTVIGFSVHDTIVVFDRIRENMQRRTVETFEEVVNASLVQTMARSLNTSLTVLFTLAALTLFGGVSIRPFTGTLLLGIFSGTYSSIFNASMLLVIWEKGELGLGWLRARFGGGSAVAQNGRRSRERELTSTRG